MSKTYLGDGAFADFDGFHIIISCDRANGENFVCLDDVCLNAFLKFAERTHDVEITVKKKPIEMPEEEPF